MAAFTIEVQELLDGTFLAECQDVPELLAISTDEDQAVADVIEAICSRVLH